MVVVGREGIRVLELDSAFECIDGIVENADGLYGSDHDRNGAATRITGARAIITWPGNIQPLDGYVAGGHVKDQTD